MKKYFIGIAGIIFFFIGAFIPLGYLNDYPMIIAPIVDFPSSVSEIWTWKDISAFAITYLIFIILSVYFLLKENHLWLQISAVIQIIISSLIFFSIWFVDLQTIDISKFAVDYGLGWVFIMGGIILQFVQADQIKKAAVKK